MNATAAAASVRWILVVVGLAGPVGAAGRAEVPTARAAGPSPGQAVVAVAKGRPTRPAVTRYGRELLANGGFEAPAMNPGAWDVFPQIPGWSTASGPGIEVQNHAAGSPFGGRQLVELDSHGPTSMYQDVPTEPGVEYELRLRFSARPGTAADDNDVEVWFGATRLTTLRASGESLADTRWAAETLRGTAVGDTTRLEFRYVGPANGLGGYLDDVSLRAVIPGASRR